MPPTTEPVWNRVHAGLIALLAAINAQAQPTVYWNTVRKVYDFDQDTWDKSNVPGLACYPAPGSAPRTYEGGSRTVTVVQPFVIYGMIPDDRADGVSYVKRAYRLVADIHRAIYVAPDLNIAEVQRVAFPASPYIQPYILSSKLEMVEVRYGCIVKHMAKDDAP